MTRLLGTGDCLSSVGHRSADKMWYWIISYFIILQMCHKVLSITFAYLLCFYIASLPVQRCCLISPPSFNGYSEKVMREAADALSWIGITISGRIINNLRYADDIVLVATSKETLQQLMDRVNEASGKYGLEINTKKTKVMVVSRTCEKITITCNGENLEQVESFRYLGAIVEENGDGGKEIRARLGMA